MNPRPAIAILTLLALTPLTAQESDDPLDALVEQERIRKIVETAFSEVTEARFRYRDSAVFVDAYTDIAYGLGTADPAVVPLLANEAMLADPNTFYLATYALAFQGTPEAIEALYAAIERAENDDSSFAVDRKAQLVWAIAAAGDVGALEAASNGRHDTSGSGAYRTVTVLEAAAMLTAPESLSILNEELSGKNLPLPESSRRTLYGLQAISRIGHASSLPVLLRHVESESTLARLWAVYGLAYHAGDSAVDALLAALHDEETQVATNAARSLSLLLPKGRFDQVAKDLPNVEDSGARGYLYKMLVGLDPDAAIPLLSGFTRGRPTKERLDLCRAVTGIEAAAAVLDLLIDLVGDPDTQVAVCGVRALSPHDNPRARRVLIRAIDSPRWPVAQQASKLSADEGVIDAAAAIRERLKRELPRIVRNPAEKVKSEWLLDQLVKLGDLDAIDDLEAALKKPYDPTTLVKIEDSLKRLRALRDAGNSRKKWEVLAFHDDASLRSMAYENVGRLLKPNAAGDILVRAFGRLEPGEGRVVLERLAEVDTQAARDLVETILTAPEYQRPELHAVRDVAAWAARRFGGERMVASLEHSIELRQGRDLRPMIYYALLRGADAIPLIERHLAPRMRFKTDSRGLEYEYLRRLLLALERGNSLRFADLPPRKIILI